MTTLHTVKESAIILRVSEGWIRQRIAKGLIEVVRLGKRTMLSDSTIDELIQKGTVKPVE